MSEKRINRRLATPESPENIQRLLNTSRLQDMLQKRSTRGGIENTFLFESIVGVSREHFRPQITVVTGGIAAGKNMRKRMGESIERWRSNHCDLLTDIIQEAMNGVG